MCVLLFFYSLLRSDAIRPAAHRNPAILSVISRPPIHISTIDPQQRAFLHYLRIFLLRRPSLPTALSRCRPQLWGFHMDPNENASPPCLNHIVNLHSFQSRSAAPTQSFATASKARLHYLSTWLPVRAGHVSLSIVDVPLAQGKEVCSVHFSHYIRGLMHGFPARRCSGCPRQDDDLIRDEDYVHSPPPSPKPNSQSLPKGDVSTGEHGSGWLYGWF
ncbi:hypothetical protein DFH29DRAFT_1003833 [Suillus ampliporus]|nr:hypothetical protein DFH29DRAFT_1003833 [Suillus ampliporus]